MPGKPGKPREPPGGSEQPLGGKNLRAPLFPFVPLHFRGVAELCLGLWHTCKITEVCSQLRCPEPFASQRRRRREQQEARSPPGLPSESSSRPKARASGAMSACSQSGFSKLPQWSQWGGVFYKDHFLYNK